MNIRMNKTAIFMFVASSLLALGACQTIPYADRLAQFETSMKDKFVGKSYDEVILAYGPPKSTYDLTDGRLVAQYSDESEDTSGGGTYTSWETFARDRVIVDKNGNQHVVRFYDQIPVTSYEPLYTTTRRCVKRFVILRNRIVESFAWEGNSCF